MFVWKINHKTVLLTVDFNTQLQSSIKTVLCDFYKYSFIILQELMAISFSKLIYKIKISWTKNKVEEKLSFLRLLSKSQGSIEVIATPNKQILIQSLLISPEKFIKHLNLRKYVLAWLYSSRSRKGKESCMPGKQGVQLSFRLDAEVFEATLQIFLFSFNSNEYARGSRIFIKKDN